MVVSEGWEESKGQESDYDARISSGGDLCIGFCDFEFPTILDIQNRVRSGYSDRPYYLKGASSQIDVVTDHKNLEYFATMKLLS